jgi:nickel/cobalt transporter (NicO) family protein
MTDLTTLVQHGTTSAWVLILSALVLGALHGLEPGHSKTMMAAFIVAVKGTIGQAILLAAAATVSHTAIVWVVALLGMYFGSQINAESAEPYLQTASGILILAIAAWMLLRVWKDQKRAKDEARHGHHSHDDHSHHDHSHHHDHTHDHGHHHEELEGLNVSAAEFEDAHQRAHANDIRRRFTNRDVTTGQIITFGLTGGLIPCGAAITVLLLCLQLKKFVLGVLLVLCFSIGLAATLMASGVVAAWGTTHLRKHMTSVRFQNFARVAPYLSSVVVVVLGVYVAFSGVHHLQ